MSDPVNEIIRVRLKVDIQKLERMYYILAKPYGWVKRKNYFQRVKPNGEVVDAYCLLGAGMQVIEDGGWEERGNEVARILDFQSLYSVTGWNDEEKRRKREVLDRIMDCIEENRRRLKELDEQPV